MVAILLRVCRIPPVAGVGTPRGRLPHNPGDHLLSRREPGRHGVFGHGAARAAVWPGARTPTDDIYHFGRKFGHHSAIQPEPEHRRRRAGGPTVHQRIGDLSAGRPSHTAGVQQSQSGRYANPHTGPDLQNASAFASRRSGGHATGAEDFAIARRWTRKLERRAAARCAHSSQSYIARRSWADTRGPARRTGGGQRESGQR
jgi:hypothetical protein